MFQSMYPTMKPFSILDLLSSKFLYEKFLDGLSAQKESSVLSYGDFVNQVIWDNKNLAVQ